MMKSRMESWTDKILERLEADGATDGLEEDACKFGIEVMLLRAVHVISYTVLAVAMKKLPEFLLLFCTLSIFRRSTGGFHAKTRRGCYFFSCTVIAAALMLCNVRLSLWQMHLLLLLALAILQVISPVENTNRRLEIAEIRFFRRKLAGLSVLSYGLFLLIAFFNRQAAWVLEAGILANVCLVILGKLQNNASAKKV